MNHKIYKKVVLVIIDGFGIAPPGYGNAVTQAETPSFDYLAANFPGLVLQASGPLVGLPWGEMGNSEVGHLNIGAGRIVGQDLPRITNSIQNGEFFKNKTFLEAIEHCKKYRSDFHIMGLISQGGVHSLDEHVFALLSMAEANGLKRVYIHMFADGRDTEPKVALDTIAKLKQKIREIGIGEVASITGRFYAMDRGGHWNQTLMTYKALTEGIGEFAQSAEEAVNASYNKQIFDEMIRPTVIKKGDKPVATIKDNDAVVFINFRQDRALQLTSIFTEPNTLPEKNIDRPLQNLYFVTMTEYRPDLPVRVAFAPMDLKNSLSGIISQNKLTQFHIAESEKYAHVTAFFNCGKTDKAPGEEWVIVTSPENNNRNYSDHPEMSAEKLSDILSEKILKTDINFFVANFANPDMVGHTGDLRATIDAVESVDKCIKKIVDASLKADAFLVITADHGNAEQMINPRTGDIDKDHTTNPVPFLAISNALKFAKPSKFKYSSFSEKTASGAICDIAPTVLDLLGLPKPTEMTGVNLLDFIDEVPQNGYAVKDKT